MGLGMACKCRVMWGYVLLYRAMYGYVGVCRASYGYVWLCRANVGLTCRGVFVFRVTKSYATY